MPGLLTIREAADYLQVSVWTVRDWRRKGIGPQAAKLGKHLRYRPEELQRWVKEQEQTDLAARVR